MELILFMNDYKKRIIDDILKEKLESKGAILIEGARKTGKSYLLFNIFYNYLIDNGISDENIIRINLESIRYENLRNLNALYNYLVSKIINNKKYYIFIDEIQLMDRFEDVVNGVKTDFNCDLYITGSNSKLLSSEINTKLRGRGIEIKVYPLSFKEFYDGKKDKNVAFNEYIRFGGLPYINSLDKEYEKKNI